MSTDTTDRTVLEHPVLTCLGAVDEALRGVAEVEPMFMTAPDKATALLAASRLMDRLGELRLRMLTSADDVAAAEAMRDPAAWLAHHARLDGIETRRLQRLAAALAQRHARVRDAVRDGGVNLAQAAVIVHAIDELPGDLDPALRDLAEAHLVEQASHFGPFQLRILGRRILHVIAPEVGEDEERRQLEQQERDAARRTFLRTHANGDGTTDIRGRVSDAVAARLLAYLHAFTSPRRDHLHDDPFAGAPEPPEQPEPARPHPGPHPSAGSEAAQGRPSPGEPRPDEAAPDGAEPETARTAALSRPTERRPYDQRLGHALGAFLEAVDPQRLPLHGGDATTIMITIDFEALRDRLGVGLIGDQPVTADQVRRLACTAGLVPVVLGADSEILDVGRKTRLYRPPQRRVMALRDVTCRGEGCDIPAAWCEAHHHGQTWAGGGSTSVDDGVLFCSHHHHCAHDHRYELELLANGRIRFRQRR